MAQLPLIRQNQAANAHIDGATPSYLPTSINQPNQNMPHRSELSQERRQNHQERHQSCPRTGGKTTRKDIRVVPGQEAKPPGKTSELSFLGHRWRNCLLSWDSSDGLINHPGENAACFRFPPTVRVGAKRSPRLVALGSLPWGDTTGRQRGDKGEKERGEQKERAK